MATDDTTTREMHVEGTDELRLHAWAADGKPQTEETIATLARYSEIELWALAGIFLGQLDDEFARFIAHYAALVLDATTYRGEGIVGHERPTAEHPNPDPVPIWQKWIERRAHD